MSQANYAHLADWGEMGDRIEAFDWSRTPLGPLAAWPRSLQTALQIVLRSRDPMCVWWGPELIHLYNDAYIRVLGKRHPAALGRAAPAIWPEIWPIVGPETGAVLARGEAGRSVRIALATERDGRSQETYLTFSYSPLPDDKGGVGGVLCTVADETEHLLARRRLRTLHALAKLVAPAETCEAVCALAATALGENPRDVPFAFLYLLDDDGRRLRLAGTAGADHDRPLAPVEFDLHEADGRWPLRQVLASGKSQDVDGNPGQAALVLPLAGPGEVRLDDARPAHARMVGLLVVGLAPDLDLDEDYRGFLGLIAGQIAAAIAHVRTSEQGRGRVDAPPEREDVETGVLPAVGPAVGVGRLGALVAAREPMRLEPACEAAGARLRPGEVDADMRPQSRRGPSDPGACSCTLGEKMPLRRCQMRCRVLQESLRDAFAQVAMDGRILDCNEIFCRMLDYSPEEVRALTYRELTPACWHAREEEIIREQVLQRGHSDLYEKEYRRKDGAILPVELRTILSRDEEGRPSAMWAIVRDIGERKRVEAELQRLAQQRQLALDAARLGWWHYDTLTEVVTYDRRYRQIFDVTGTERPNAELLGRLHPDDLPGVRTMVEAALDPNDPKPYCAEYRIRRGDGSLRWVEAHGIATFSGEDDRRHAIALVGTVQDITQRKRVEQALQSARSRAETKTRHLEALLQALPVGVVVTDARGGILLANGRDEEIWGPRPATRGVEDYAQYQAWWADSGKPVAPQEWASAQAVDKGEKVIGQVLEIRRFDGERRCILNSAVPIRDGEGRVVGSAVAIQDITELRCAEAAARASEEKFKTLVEHSPDIISRLDRDRRHIFVNSAITRVTGLGPEHYLGKTNPELGMPAELCRQWDECLDEVFTAGRAVTLEFAFPGPEGLRYYSSLIVPEWAPDGTVQSALGIARDITERKQAEEELREVGRRKDELLAMLAHELRNPLAPIRTGVELLGLARGDAATTAEIVPMMQRQLGHLVRLVDDLLEVSRINRGRIELRPERVDLAEILGHAIENSLPFVEVGCHELEVDVAPDQFVLEADRVRLVQVFANLLDNAAKYTPPGGQIRVTGRRIDGEAVVSIRDTGQGIPTEMLPLVFDLFVQADRSTSRATSGLGIGLFLVRNLVELHGGRVEARSEGPGRGSELIVSLPLTDRVAFETARTASPESAGMSRRVLVVDDNRDAADSLGLLLETLGAEVRVAYDGPSALAALTAFGPAAVLLDIGMPGMDGYEAAGHIRRATDGQDITLIAVTGWGQDEDRRRSAEAGFDHHLTKPLDLARLQAIFTSLAG